MTRPAAIVLADGAPPGLVAYLGPDRAARLHEVMVARANAWADAVGEPFVFSEAGLPLGARIASAFRDVFASHGGPAVLVGTDTPLRPDHARAALDDLAEGIDVTLGPSSDGGYYLVGLAEPRDAIFALPEEKWGGPEVMFLTMQAAVEAGLSIGMLRAERALVEEADARALLADPIAPADIVAALRP